MRATGTEIASRARGDVRHADVLVVGGGPSGAACAYWLANAGHDVIVVERKRYPREKTCGDGLTPRSVKQLEDMGLGEELAGAGHRFSGLRSHGFGRTLELSWPDHPELPSYGYVITRKDLDALVAERAAKAGATVWDGTEALEPIVEGGLVRGALVKRKPAPDSQGDSAAADGSPVEVRARYTVVADGANSRFGRSLGTSRNRGYPLGMAIRGYWLSPRHDEPWIDSWLDIRDGDGNVLPGYGWIF
ncbi:MAG TPA: FAD-dependent oxidoreductase, partial [Acidimicrobiales bacterium]|nr:FAD-dependent oxidoreductase [Acidimicrobiales bacterium]